MRTLVLVLCFLSTISSYAQETVTTKSGLKYAILHSGGGDQAYANRMVKVKYIGMFEAGDTFDQNQTGNFEFVLGRGQVIKGWDEGIRFMQTGDIYKFWIPAALAYGKKGVPDVIPPDTPLIFEVELLEVNDIPNEY